MDCDFELEPMSKEESEASMYDMAGFVEFNLRVDKYEKETGKKMYLNAKDFDDWYEKNYLLESEVNL